MRWGVRDEATDDHMTSELCMREIRECQRLSTGPNFVVSAPFFTKFFEAASSTALHTYISGADPGGGARGHVPP